MMTQGASCDYMTVAEAGRARGAKEKRIGS